MCAGHWNALITTSIKESGVILGAIPTVLLFAGTMWLARTLCKKWDIHKANKEAQKNSLEQNQQTIPNNDNQIRFCRRCGEKLINNSQFCRKCGTKIVEE
jgi:ribosomal protein L40E